MPYMTDTTLTNSSLEPFMRLVTWNAGRGKFAKKAQLLAGMGADIAVIPEIAKPELINEHCLWFGTNPNQGIAITSSPSYTLTPIPEKQRRPDILSRPGLKAH